MVPSERWQRLSALYDAAMAVEAGAREAFVRRECGGDEALRREVMSLVASPDSAAAFLSRPAVGVAMMGSGSRDERSGTLTFTPGDTLGPYTIEALLGRGGMGEVYRARDTRLGRNVAIKILPQAFTNAPDRLARFESEARVLAALNHPHISAIYGLEERDGIRALVLELVEGRSLQAMIPLPLADALSIARQIAEALDAAHDRGIVHRDLKPANVAVTVDGTVKVLDFGLAKILDGVPGSASVREVVTALARTEDGLILGTAAYMSPEQARGQTVDKRTDIWAFGCVLYEMLTGRSVFQGETVSDLLAAILEREPAWSALPPQTPVSVRRLLVRCLDKDPKRRLRDIGDARLELDPSPPLELTVPTPGPAPRRAISRRVWLGLAGVPAVAAFAAGRLWRPAPSSPTYHRVTFRRGIVWSARFSPDGQTVLYSATWEGGGHEIYSTRPENPESRPLGQPDADVLSVSPSGEVAIILRPSRRGGIIHGRGTLARVGLSGIAARPIHDDVVTADWGPDGETLGIVRVINGKYRLEFPLETVLYESTNQIVSLRVAPDGQSVAFCETTSVSVVDLQGHVRVLSGGWAIVYSVAWSSDGDEVWFNASHLESGRTTAAVFAVSLSGQQRTVLQLPIGVNMRDRSREGRLLVSVGLGTKGIRYRERSTGRERDLSWLDWGLVADISADGSTLLFSEGGTAGSIGRSVYIRGVDGSPAIRLGTGLAEALSPDGLTALALEEDVRLIALPVGPGSRRTLTDDLFDCSAARWFPDGKRILVAASESGRPARAWVLDPDRGSMDPVTPEGITGIFVSPDGAWFLAGSPNRLYPVAGGNPRPIPGLTTADQPLGWDRNSRHAYYRRDFEPDDVNRVSVVRIDVQTGHRESWADLFPEAVRAASMLPIAISSDGQALAYTYTRSLTDLYVVDGVT